jgi:hypothetical protein
MTVISLEAARKLRQRLRPAPEEFRAEAALDGFAAGRLPFTEVLQALVAPFQDPAPGDRPVCAVDGWAPATFRRRSSPA